MQTQPAVLRAGFARLWAHTGALLVLPVVRGPHCW